MYEVDFGKIKDFEDYPIIGARQGDIVHKRGCSKLKDFPHKRGFEDIEDAIRSGYIPADCLKKEFERFLRCHRF